ncbi:MAG: hypothetical protein DKT66_27665 [Candidatus Melainabacteria bacterium]|nr:MAG: hypothetical protein DKT66_27665 [Candidatus Melainabacteria bacterium]
MQLSNDLKVFLSIGIAGSIICAILYGVFSGDWRQFIVCAPFAIALAPGYLTLLPRGGMRHGNICECKKRDNTCEFRFWIEHYQKVILFIPLALASVFLQAFISGDLQRALFETSVATATVIFFSSICVYSFYLLTRPQVTED